jgi:hypothetical protein
MDTASMSPAIVRAVYPHGHEADQGADAGAEGDPDEAAGSNAPGDSDAAAGSDGVGVGDGVAGIEGPTDAGEASHVSPIPDTGAAEPSDEAEVPGFAGGVGSAEDDRVGLGVGQEGASTGKSVSGGVATDAQGADGFTQDMHSDVGISGEMDPDEAARKALETLVDDSSVVADAAESADSSPAPVSGSGSAGGVEAADRGARVDAGIRVDGESRAEKEAPPAPQPPETTMGFPRLWQSTGEEDLAFGQLTGAFTPIEEPDAAVPRQKRARTLFKPKVPTIEAPEVWQSTEEEELPFGETTGKILPVDEPYDSDVLELEDIDGGYADDAASPDSAGEDSARYVQVSTGMQVPVREPYYLQQSVIGANRGDSRSRSVPHGVPSAESPRATSRYLASKARSTARAFEQQVPLKRAWNALTSGMHWMRRVLLLGLVTLIPLFGPMVVRGFSYTQARNVMFGIDEMLPDRLQLHRYLLPGLKLFFLLIPFELVFGLVMGAIGLIPVVGGFLGVVFAALSLPLLVSCCFRTTVCEKVGAGFNIQYAAGLLKSRRGHRPAVDILLPGLFGMLVSFMIGFIFFMVITFTVGFSLSNLTMLRLNAAEQIAELSPWLRMLAGVLLLVMTWLISSVMAAARLVYTHAFACACTPLEDELWPDLDAAARVFASARDKAGDRAPGPVATSPGHVTWSRGAASPDDRPHDASRAPRARSGSHGYDPTYEPLGYGDSHERVEAREAVSVGALPDICLVDAETGERYALGRFPVVVGTGKGSTMQVRGHGASGVRYACIIKRPDGAYLLKSLDAGGTTFVNGFDVPGSETVEIVDGDLLAFGMQGFIFEVL